MFRSAFLAIFLLTASPAFAVSLWKDDPIAIARAHCRLLLLAGDDSRVLVPGLLDAIAGPDGYNGAMDERFKTIYIGMTGGLPDFGFVIGPRWETATRDQRRDFNRAFTDFVYKRFKLKKGVLAETNCEMQSKLTVISQPPKSKIQGAKVSTLLFDEMDRPVRVIYILVKEPGAVWEIRHLQLHATDLYDSYTEVMNQLLAGGGYEGAIAWLKQQ